MRYTKKWQDDEEVHDELLQEGQFGEVDEEVQNQIHLV